MVPGDNVRRRYREDQDWIAEVTSGDYQKYYDQMYGNR